MDLGSSPIQLATGAVAALALVASLIVVAVRRRRERRRLRAHFGPEYARTVRESPSRRVAVLDLREREALRATLEIRDLSTADRDLVRRHMATLQFAFVEDPAAVMLSAGRVATEVLQAQGYPVDEDAETGLRLFSVDHPTHALALRTVLEGDYRGDVGAMQVAFAGLRRALAETAGISYGAQDAAAAPDLAG